MAKPKKQFVCQACGGVTPRWQGQCPDCGDWNSLVEDAGAVVTPFSARHDLRGGGRRVELVGLDADVALPPRTSTGIAEFDRALGGGLVAGSATLIGGDPGIGKSTLLLQAAGRIAARGGVLANADLTLLCERPRIGPHRDAMQARLAELLGTEPSRVGVKASTTERLGFTGRGEGIAAQAAAMLLLPPG